MRSRTRNLAVFLALAVVAGAAAASDLWLHVKVDEGGDGAKVRVNLPLALVETAARMIPEEHMEHAHRAGRHIQADLEDLREIWREISNSPDMTFVDVSEDDGTARVWKVGSTVFVEVREDDEQVDVRVPVAMVEALLASEDDQIDIEAAIAALAEHGEGNYVTVRDGDEKVEVWVDHNPETR